MKTTNQIDREANERKAREIAEKIVGNNHYSYFDDFKQCALEAMQWKDKERKELWRITRNHYQEWAEEQIAKEKQKLIEKACEFIESHGFVYHVDFPNLAAVVFHYSHKDALIEDFKKEMKGE